MLRTLWSATHLYGRERNEGVWTRRVKFLLRAMAQWPYSTRWFRFLQEQPELAAALAQQPQWLHKLQRPYLCAGYGTRTKLQLLRQHFTLFLNHLPQTLRVSLLTKHSVVMATVTGKSGAAYSIKLSLTQTMDKEGELMLTLVPEAGQHSLATLAFSFGVGQQDQAKIYVGCLQGPNKEGGREQFREVTKDLHGLMPKMLLVKALCALARLMDIDSVLAVSNQAHVHNSAWRRYKAIQADYDTFWGSLGGIRLNAQHFLLHTAQHERPLSEVPSSKRAQYQRRRAVESHIASQFELFWNEDESMICLDMFTCQAETVPASDRPAHGWNAWPEPQPETPPRDNSLQPA